MSAASNAPVNRALYLFVRAVANLLFRVVWRLKVVGAENVPRTGPLIVAPNHKSYGDPPLVGVALPREVHYLAKKELFSFPPFGWLIRNLNAHPLNRSGDIAAFREATRILKAGGGLILFPEGRRVDEEGFGQAKAGIGMLAVMSGAPILPVYLHNSGYLKYFRRVEVHFGKPIDHQGEKPYQEIAARVMAEIAALSQAQETVIFEEQRGENMLLWTPISAVNPLEQGVPPPVSPGPSGHRKIKTMKITKRGNGIWRAWL